MAEDSGIDVELLEPLLRQLVAAVGLAATMRLVERVGGIPFYVPKDASPEHWTVVDGVLSVDQLRAICRLAGGDRLVISKATRALRDLRDRQLLAARSASSIRQLAMAHGLTRRRVQQIMAEGHPGASGDGDEGCGQDSGGQGSLFG